MGDGAQSGRAAADVRAGTGSTGRFSGRTWCRLSGPRPTGLPLSDVSAEQHGGTLRLRSAPWGAKLKERSQGAVKPTVTLCYVLAFLLFFPCTSLARIPIVEGSEDLTELFGSAGFVFHAQIVNIDAPPIMLTVHIQALPPSCRPVVQGDYRCKDRAPTIRIQPDRRQWTLVHRSWRIGFYSQQRSNRDCLSFPTIAMEDSLYLYSRRYSQQNRHSSAAKQPCSRTSRSGSRSSPGSSN